MALADDIRNLAARSVDSLNKSHDYHAFSRFVLRLPQLLAGEGRTFLFSNNVTGSQMARDAILGRAQVYATEYLTVFTFQHFVSLFEAFIFDLLRLWLSAYPASLSGRKLDFGAVLRSPDRASLIQTVVDGELNQLKYERLSEWFAYAERLAKFGCPSADEIERLAEIKASRDVLVHNNGIANTVYLAKSGIRARCKDGERLEVPDTYHRESWELMVKVVGNLSAAAISKAG
jgi:hypothetical protein